MEPEKVTPSSGHSAIKNGHNEDPEMHLSHHYNHHGYHNMNDATMIGHDIAYNQVPAQTSINPFGHVSADFLMGHYGKVQRARIEGLPPPVVNEEVIKNQDGSCFTGSDNDRPSRDSDSYDDNMINPAVNPSTSMDQSPSHFQTQHNPYSSNQGNMDWSYENVGYRAQPAYVHYNQPVSYHQDNSTASFYTQLHGPLPTHGIHDPSTLTGVSSPSTTSHHVVWQEGSSHPYLPRSQTPTSDNSSNNHYPTDSRYGQRRSTTVSQV
jgi:hypothetical protein